MYLPLVYMFVFLISVRTSHITQMCAVRNDDVFSIYVMPKVYITSASANLTGLRCRNGTMYHNGTRVEAVPIRSALEKFCRFLSKSTNNVIIGHNVQIYDCHVLLNALEACKMTSTFENHCLGFVDTMKLFKLVKPDLRVYSQCSLVRSILGENYSAHNATEDALALKRLVCHCDISRENKERASFSFETTVQSYKQSLRLRSFKLFLREEVLTPAMVKQLSASGLCSHHLIVAFNLNGIAGITDLFTAENERGRPRVTNSRETISAVSDFLGKILRV